MNKEVPTKTNDSPKCINEIANLTMGSKGSRPVHGDSDASCHNRSLSLDKRLMDDTHLNEAVLATKW